MRANESEYVRYALESCRRCRCHCHIQNSIWMLGLCERETIAGGYTTVYDYLTKMAFSLKNYYDFARGTGSKQPAMRYL